jgi:hypothetical protein
MAALEVAARIQLQTTPITMAEPVLQVKEMRVELDQEILHTDIQPEVVEVQVQQAEMLLLRKQVRVVLEKFLQLLVTHMVAAVVVDATVEDHQEVA